MKTKTIVSGTQREIGAVTKLAAMARVFVEVREGEHKHIDEAVAYDLLKCSVDDYKKVINERK